MTPPRKSSSDGGEGAAASRAPLGIIRPSRPAKLEVSEAEKPILKILLETNKQSRDRVILWALHYARARDKVRDRKGKINDRRKWGAFGKLRTGNADANSQVFFVWSLLQPSLLKAQGNPVYNDFSLEEVSDPKLDKDRKHEIERAALLIDALEITYGDKAAADQWAKVIGNLQAVATHSYELARQTLLYDQASQDERPGSEERQGQFMPEKNKRSVDSRGAKAETTKRSRFAELRKGRRGLVTYVKTDKADDFKAIAAAKEKGVEAYLEELVLKEIEANEHLIERGRKKLKEPRRYRSRASIELEEQNRRLREQLHDAGLKPR